MARLKGSFPLTFNGQDIGRAYIISQDENGIIVDLKINDNLFTDALIAREVLGELPPMSFGFEVAPIEPKGLMQIIPFEPVDLTAYRKAWEDLSEDEKQEFTLAVNRYMQERYGKSTRWQG